MTIRFSNKLGTELFQPFWAALQAGEFLTDAAALAADPTTPGEFELYYDV